MTKTQTADYNGEIEMCGVYAGGVLGGLTIGVLGDFLNTEHNTMAFYFVGVLMGAIGGFIAAKMFRKLA
jgi:hypothetical protein